MAEAVTFATYYQMWVDRMQTGHNPESRAMHSGYNPRINEPLSTDAAKNASNDLVVGVLDLPTDKSMVLGDLGCGVGGTAFYMTEAFPNSRIVAVNLHRPQLQVLTSFSDFHSDRIIPINADFTRLPIPDASLDSAYAIESSSHAADKLAFFDEALRSLKPGGKLVVLDVFDKRAPENQSERELLQQSHDGFVVPDWHDADTAAQLPHATLTDITPHIMQDFERSCMNALEKIQTATNPVLCAHLRAIIASYECLQLGLIQYGLLVAQKSMK